MVIDTDRLVNQIHADVEGVSETGFPLDVFPERIQKIVYELVTYENFNLEYSASIVLSAFATAIGNTYHVKIKGKWETACALYMILVGRPGLGKTPPLGFLYFPIRAFDNEMLKKAYNEYDAYAQQQAAKKDGEIKDPMEKPRLVQTVISDFTQEAMLSIHYDNPRGIVLLVDEVVSLFNSVKRYSAKSNLIEDLLSAYSGQPLKAVRKSEVFPICIPHPCINLIGGIQTNLLDEIFRKEYVANGLTDRFLFVFPKNKKIPKWQIGIEKEKRPDTMSKWTYYINKVLNIPCPLGEDGTTAQPKVLEFSDEAMTYFYNWNNSIIDEVNGIEDDNEVESRKMKLCGNAARLALVLQLMRWSAGECPMDCIDIESVKGAIRLIDYFEDSYQRVKAISGIDEPNKNQDSWLAFVGNRFSSAEAELAGQRVGISRRTVFSSLKRLCESNPPVLQKVKQGIYEKIVKDCTTAQLHNALLHFRILIIQNPSVKRKCKVQKCRVQPMHRKEAAMSEHRFHLQKYKPGSKTSCPHCKKARCFVHYVDDEGKIVFPNYVGRCDHENSCGYHYTPKDYYHDNPDEMPKDWMDDNAPLYNKVWESTKGKEEPKPIEPSYIPLEVAERSIASYKTKNPLYIYLRGVIGESETNRIFRLYCVGTANKWGGSTVFWQLDVNGNVRAGKIMGYDRKTDHRIKEPQSQVTWAHSELKLSDFHLVQCLFGEHLLKERPTAPVALVESEKTALIMSHFMPDLLWLATGGMDGCFNEKTMQVLRGRTVILIPDLGGWDKWQKKAQVLKSICKRVVMSDVIEKQANDEHRQQGLDIADFFLMKATPHEILADMIRRNPAIQSLVDKLNLEICDEEESRYTGPLPGLRW